MNTIIEEIDNEYSDLTNSDDEDKETSHFHFEEIEWFEGVHQTTGELPNRGFKLIFIYLNCEYFQTGEISRYIGWTIIVYLNKRPIIPTLITGAEVPEESRQIPNS